MNIGTVVQGGESAFAKAEYDARVAKARQGLASAGLDVMVVTGPENIFYLTGQQTPGYYTFQALVLPVDGEPLFVIRQLEYFNFIANTFIPDAAVYQDSEDPVSFLTRVMRDKRWGRSAMPRASSRSFAPSSRPRRSGSWGARPPMSMPA